MDNRVEGQEAEKRDIERRTYIRESVNLLTLLTGVLYGELDERLEIKEAVKKQMKKPVPPHVNWTFCFGGISFFLYIILAITGVLLLMYYQPTTTGAYDSVVLITNIVPYGWLIRGLHHWAANLMTLMVVLHMMKVFFYGAYKPPRDLNWVVGVILLFLTLIFGFSGYLLPWNQISYWATTVATDGVGAIPLIGDHLKYFVRGGPEVSQLTLTRFFALHVVVLPAVMFILLFLHFGMIRKQGIAGPL